MFVKYTFFLLATIFTFSHAGVKLGVDIFFEKDFVKEIEGKKIGVITNHTGRDKDLNLTSKKFIDNAGKYEIKAFFSPEHGLDGSSMAGDKVGNNKYHNIIVYSLYGKNRRPTDEMLKDIDVLIYDIQDIGSRSYTYLSTLCYVMEEAVKKKIKVIVLDRPNPMGGEIVDGPMLDEKFRSFIGYINVPYCHGMTIGELANFFNGEYKIGCDLQVISMEGWNRSMSYVDTNLAWVPTSPNIPEADTPFYYPTTGVLGELKLLNIGIGYTMPFKIVGAPWIDAKKFVAKLSSQKLKGVKFLPFYFRSFYGLYKGETCQGVKIIITEKKKYRPLAVQYLILGMIKSMYPKEFEKRIKISAQAKDLFNKANGTDEVYKILLSEKYPAWKLINYHKEKRTDFMKIREKYLNSSYNLK